MGLKMVVRNMFNLLIKVGRCSWLSRAFFFWIWDMNKSQSQCSCFFLGEGQGFPYIFVGNSSHEKIRNDSQQLADFFRRRIYTGIAPSTFTLRRLVLLTYLNGTSSSSKSATKSAGVWATHCNNSTIPSTFTSSPVPTATSRMGLLAAWTYLPSIRRCHEVYG